MALDYRVYHSTQNMVEVKLDANSAPLLFSAWTTPFNSESQARLCSDKDYFFQRFQNVIAMPKTKAFCSPDIRDKFKKYVSHQSLTPMLDQIDDEFSYPLIVKRNRGAWGNQVYQADNRNEAQIALSHIFDVNRRDFDYIALAQTKLNIAQEFRLIYVKASLQFVYLKDNSQATFSGNLSPLHWSGAKAVVINEPELLKRLDQFCQPLIAELGVGFSGLDVVITDNDEVYLIEANTSPGFDQIVKDGGEAAVIATYCNLLQSAKSLS